MTQALNSDQPQSNEKFDQPVVLRQSPVLSRSIVWVILALTVSSITWAAIAKIEQVVTATGQLQPLEAVREVQSPINGVVKDVFVKDGDRVTANQPLLTFDSEAAQASKTSLLAIQKSLNQENQLYRAIIAETADIPVLQAQIDKMRLPPEVTALARNRLSLVAEAQVLRAQLGNSGRSLSGDQSARLAAAEQEEKSRIASAQLELEQLQKTLEQNTIQLADLRAQLKTDREVLAEIRDRNQKALKQAEESLKIETNILKAIEDPKLEGAIARLQIERQKQQVNDRNAQLIEQRATGGIELDQQQQRVDSRLAEINQLLKEEKRLQLDIRQAREQLINTKSLSERTVREQLDAVQQRLAAIDSELNKVIVENTKRLSEIDSQLAQANETLAYQEVKAPISGTVFDLKASPRFVPRSGQAEPLLKIVPDDILVAEVFVTNQDIGLVVDRCREKSVESSDKTAETEKDQPQETTIIPKQKDTSCLAHVKADVRIDSFSFSQYGSIVGEVVSIGSDALPPDEIHAYYRFPVRIKLSEQDLRGLPLQSGMSVNVNIIIREKRSVLSLMTDLFSQRVDSMKRSR